MRKQSRTRNFCKHQGSSLARGGPQRALAHPSPNFQKKVKFLLQTISTNFTLIRDNVVQFFALWFPCRGLCHWKFFVINDQILEIDCVSGFSKILNYT